MDLEPIDLLSRLLEPLARLCLPMAALLAVLVVRAVLHRRAAVSWREGSHYVSLSAPPEVEPVSAGAAWRQLGGVEQGPWSRFWFGQPWLIWEYAWVEARFTVRVWVPSKIDPALVVKTLKARWPGADATVSEAVAPFDLQGAARGGHVRWRTGTAAPVAEGTGEDLLRGLLEAGPSPDGSQRTVVQVVAAPASRRQVARLRAHTEAPGGKNSLVDELLSFILPHYGQQGKVSESAWAREQRKALGTRLSAGRMWHVGVRWVVTGQVRRADALAAHERSVSTAVGGMLDWGHRRVRLSRAARQCAEWRAPSRTAMLNTAELAALAHLPTDKIVPSLERAGARTVAPSANVRAGGRSTKVLGTAATTGRKVALQVKDARYHVHLIGKTGSGKSTTLQHLALSDIRDRRGLVLIDPAGDLVDDILDRLDPEEVAGRLYLIDPRADIQPGLAPLEGADEHLVADNLVSICRNIWPRFWGPRADMILQTALLSLRANKKPLTQLPNLLMSPRFRNRIMAELQKASPADIPESGRLEDGDMTGLAGFWSWYNDMSPGVQNQAAGPVLARMRALMGRPFVRNLFGEPKASFDMADVLDRGGIVLARLSKGELGEDTAKLVGSILVAKVWQAATARSLTPEPKRPDCSLIMDEAHNWLNLPTGLDDMLAEARKLHLSITLAHQYLAQLPKPMELAIAGQARTKLYFNTSPEDARRLAQHSVPLSDYDLSHLADYTMAARLYCDGDELPAFTLRGLPPAEPVGRAEDVRAAAARHLAGTEPVDEPELEVHSGLTAVTTADDTGQTPRRFNTRLARARAARGDSLRHDTRTHRSMPKPPEVP
jgi:hypothetical protein